MSIRTSHSCQILIIFTSHSCKILLSGLLCSRVLEMMQLNEIEESEEGEATDLVSYSKDPEYNDMTFVMRNPACCIYENKDADQLRGNREADQRLCFRYLDSTIPLLP